MTGHEMWLIRKKLGLSSREFAHVLGMGPNGTKRIQEWESGRSPIPRNMAARVRRLEAMA